jgi:hypothetical protein
MTLQHSQKQKVHSNNHNKLQCKCDYASANWLGLTALKLALQPQKHGFAAKKHGCAAKENMALQPKSMALQPWSMTFQPCSNWRVKNGPAARIQTNKQITDLSWLCSQKHMALQPKKHGFAAKNMALHA